jgi:translation initiation factor 5B
MADVLGVRIYHADIIYHLFDRFMQHRDELKQKNREEFKNIAVFPCQLSILPQVGLQLNSFPFALFCFIAVHLQR